MCLTIKEEINLHNKLDLAVQKIQWLCELPEHLIDKKVFNYQMKDFQRLANFANQHNISVDKYYNKIQGN